MPLEARLILGLMVKTNVSDVFPPLLPPLCLACWWVSVSQMASCLNNARFLDSVPVSLQ